MRINHAPCSLECPSATYSGERSFWPITLTVRASPLYSVHFSPLFFYASTKYNDNPIKGKYRNSPPLPRKLKAHPIEAMVVGVIEASVCVTVAYFIITMGGQEFENG